MGSTWDIAGRKIIYIFAILPLAYLFSLIRIAVFQLNSYTLWGSPWKSLNLHHNLG